MWRRLFGTFSEDIGIDLGTSNTRIFVKEKGLVINEPTIVAINRRLDSILAVGHIARDMVGKTPPHIDVVNPLEKGVISDFEVTEKFLKYYIDRIHEDSFTVIPRPRVIIGVPIEMTEVERKAVEDATLSGGAREVFMVEGAILAAIGARLPITESVGSMVIDIGGGKTEISVISLGGIVTSRSIQTAGMTMTRQIVQYAREVFNLLIGEMQAEQIKCSIGNCHPSFDGEQGVLRGRDLLSGLPKEIPVSDSQIREALQKPLKSLVSSIKTTLEQTPPELVADIYERGVVLVGGGSLLRGMEKLISEEAEIPVRLSEDPLTTVARGSGALLEDPALRKAVTLPSTSNDTYR